MAFPRSSTNPTLLRSSAFRSARSRAAGQSRRQLGRRSYASGGDGGHKKASSDLPWLIGSVAITVPSATWLWQQGPKKTPHHEHDHEEKHDEGEDGASEEEKSEESGSEGAETATETPDTSEDEGADTQDKESSSKPEQEESKESASDKGKDAEDSSDAGSEEEDKKNERGDQTPKASEPTSKSMHPYMADEKKSKKGEGIVETAKITGTVDRDRNIR